MSDAQWYYSRNGQQFGPLSAEVMKQLAAAGQILQTDFVWKEGLSGWLPANQVQGLFPGGPVTIKPQMMRSTPPPAAYAPPVSDDPLDQLAASSGAAVAPASSYRPHHKGQSHSGTAVAGMVVSILAFVVGGICMILLGVIGLIISATAMSGMQQSKNDDGKGMAVAGLVIGLVAGILGIVTTIIHGVEWFWHVV